MKALFQPVFLVSACAVSLSGCAGSSDKYPSLATRDAERVQGEFAPPATAPAEPIRPVASENQLTALVMQAREAEQRFRTASLRAIFLVAEAKGQSIESNRRQQAIVALADLRTIRSDTAIALAELDLLKAEAETTFAPIERIEAAQREVVTLIEGQDGTIAGLADNM